MDASTDGTSFVIVVTQGYYPFATEWTLGTDSNPDEYVSDGKANQIRGSIEPFEQLQSASNGYGGGKRFQLTTQHERKPNRTALSRNLI